MTECPVTMIPCCFFEESGLEVSRVLNNGTCVFPDAIFGSDAEDCSPNGVYDQTGGDYMNIAFAFIFIPILCSNYIFEQIRTKNNLSVRAALEKNDTNKIIPWWVEKVPFVRNIYKLRIWLSCTVSIIIHFFMKHSIQDNLPVGFRNVLMSTDAFLRPYKVIFQFIIDFVPVRISYTLCWGDQTLLHAGIAGCFLTGLLTAGSNQAIGDSSFNKLRKSYDSSTGKVRREMYSNHRQASVIVKEAKKKKVHVFDIGNTAECTDDLIFEQEEKEWKRCLRLRQSLRDQETLETQKFKETRIDELRKLCSKEKKSFRKTFNKIIDSKIEFVKSRTRMKSMKIHDCSNVDCVFCNGYYAKVLITEEELLSAGGNIKNAIPISFETPKIFIPKIRKIR